MLRNSVIGASDEVVERYCAFVEGYKGLEILNAEKLAGLGVSCGGVDSNYAIFEAEVKAEMSQMQRVIMYC
jgi:hypothetical protein